tara:strand:+ start:1350 stop:1679 length:330 start_codon:yes stop_codon:yes gene_type:complete
MKEDLVPHVIDLNIAQQGELNESWLGQFGSAIKILLRRMFGEQVFMPFRITGTRSQISAFGRAVTREKKYLQALEKHGLTNPNTFKSKAELNKAVNKFERVTGLKWPFK